MKSPFTEAWHQRGNLEAQGKGLVWLPLGPGLPLLTEISFVLYSECVGYAMRLEKQCEVQNHEIQECEHKIEESWSVAKEEAAKCKEAKEVIKALALWLHALPGKDNHGIELKVVLQEFLPNLAPKQTKMNTPRNTNMDSLSNSPIVFYSALRSKLCRSMLLNNEKMMDNNANLIIPESQQDTANGLKVEWVEQYENGAYITLTTSPSG
ncbi:unnamed protein product [Vicia faba]|uniref:BRX domain-containing protein n=1 Tax=Vicia faba TaxID=3906 RepID=A0AAV1B854_VICFA|nr:unnamed protein product [Vicia faba]